MGKHRFGTNPHWRRRVVSALAAGVFVGSLLVYADSASAGCGDYVVFRSPGHSAPLGELFAKPTGSGQVLPDQGRCHGPLCHGTRPVEPVPTPPTPEQIDQRPLALLAVIADPQCPHLAGNGWPRFDESPLDGFRQSLLRPPCA